MKSTSARRYLEHNIQSRILPWWRLPPPTCVDGFANWHVRMGVGFARIRLACKTVRSANPHQRHTVPTPRSKRLWHGDSHNIKNACESLSDSRESARLSNPCKLRIGITALNHLTTSGTHGISEQDNSRASLEFRISKCQIKNLYWNCIVIGRFVRFAQVCNMKRIDMAE